jgi:signal transduction histidine kinase
MGLGLWVTRQIVEAMGGTVFVTGELGQGSAFIVEWPRAT